MPSDITGTEILVQDDENSSRQMNFLKGPIFANIILADEINRTPPKTQSALLEAMEERTVTSIGHRFNLDLPFFVLATQNPIEQEGTYPLPAAQLDRFMVNLLLDYPEKKEEHDIMRLTVSSEPEELSPVLSKPQIMEIIETTKKMETPNDVLEYATKLTRISRPQSSDCPKVTKDFVAWGCSPRAAQSMIMGAKIRSMLYKKEYPSIADVIAISHSVMRHRIIMNYRAEADGLTPDEIIDRLIQSIPSNEIGRASCRERG